MCYLITILLYKILSLPRRKRQLDAAIYRTIPTKTRGKAKRSFVLLSGRPLRRRCRRRCGRPPLVLLLWLETNPIQREGTILHQAKVRTTWDTASSCRIPIVDHIAEQIQSFAGVLVVIHRGTMQGFSHAGGIQFLDIDGDM